MPLIILVADVIWVILCKWCKDWPTRLYPIVLPLYITGFIISRKSYCILINCLEVISSYLAILQCWFRFTLLQSYLPFRNRIPHHNVFIPASVNKWAFPFLFSKHALILGLSRAMQTAKPPSYSSIKTKRSAYCILVCWTVFSALLCSSRSEPTCTTTTLFAHLND